MDRVGECGSSCCLFVWNWRQEGGEKCDMVFEKTFVEYDCASIITIMLEISRGKVMKNMTGSDKFVIA